MAQSACLIRFHQSDQVLTILVEGRASMIHGLPVRQLGERAIHEGVRQIHFDLSSCTHVDSTFLGTMLTLKKLLDRQQGSLTVVTPSVACLRILDQMGLGDYLTTDSIALDHDRSWTELPIHNHDPNTFRHNVAQAHEELAALPGSSGDQFKAIVRSLEESKKQPPTK